MSVTSDKVDSANDTKLIHTTGQLATEDNPTDEQFGVQAKGMIRLTRDVKMYAWKEKQEKEAKKKLGGGTETITKYEYKKEWLTKGEFQDSSGVQGPGGASKSFVA